ncbi:MAG: SprT-like domain-containing protein [Chitinophagales bacterium]
MNNLEKKITEGLQNYLPKAALPTIVNWLVKYKVYLKITQKRTSKLGDYRSPFNGQGHRISINHDLNPYSFLNVMVHELAHLVTYEKYRNQVKPHGTEWKSNYQDLMAVFLGKQIFPPDLENAIKAYMQNPAASSCVDAELYKFFKKYDAPTDALPHGFKKIFVEELTQGTKFVTATGQVFVKGIKLRKRFKCQEVNTGKWYAFSPIAEVYYRPILEEKRDF